MPVSDSMDQLKAKIRNVPDFPKPGILFYDITTLLRDGEGFGQAIDALASPFKGQSIEAVVGMESRGFIFGAAVADRLGTGFIPVRKPGKLPSKTVKVTYDLEYGSDSLEMHCDAVDRGTRVLVVDDLLATGGTAKATVVPAARVRRRSGRGVVPDRARGAGRPGPPGRRAGLGRPAVLTGRRRTARLYCSAERV